MSDQSDFGRPHRRDGTSQTDRSQAALEPTYVSVDERSVKDLLAFARRLARQLRFYEATDHTLQDNGDWSGFLPPDLDLDAVVSFMEEPDAFSAEQAAAFRQPHFVLFLTFLQLLRHAQDHLNGLTRRHLDFYYRQALGLTRRAGLPDRVNVVVDLARGTDRILLPAGTPLNAGPDSQGQDRYYLTDYDTVISQAQVIGLRSIFADKQIIGIREAREAFDIPPKQAFMNMLQIALGRPLPGDPLPDYPPDRPVTYELLLDLKAFVDFTRTGLALDLATGALVRDFSDFRSLMRFKRRRDQSAGEWETINRLLEKAGRRRDPGLAWRIANPKDFEANLNLAMGGPPRFEGLPQVEDIYDLYHQRIRQDVRRWIRDRLHFESFDDFVKMMQLKMQIDAEWAEIFRILQAAGRRKKTLAPDFPVKAPSEAGAFQANLEAAVGPLAWPPETTGIDSYFQAFQAVETYFYMTAEQVSYIVAVAEKEVKAEAPPQAWSRVDAILAEAHTKKVYAGRRATLQAIREKQGFQAMIGFAAGDEDEGVSEVTALDRLLDFVPAAEDKEFLVDIDRRVAEKAPINEADWTTVYQIVELAQRRRQDFGPPVAHRTEWLNLYPAADAAGQSVSLTVDLDQETPRWETFGRGRPAPDRANPPPTSFGWAVTSPLLALSQGRRTIILTLGFEAAQFDPAKISTALTEESPFQIQFSAGQGWIEPENVVISVAEDYHRTAGLQKPEGTAPFPALRFRAVLAENIEPLSPLPAGEAVIATPWPVLRLRLRPLWSTGSDSGGDARYKTPYQTFKNLVLRRTHLKVEVTGLTPSHIQNDETGFKPGKPFEPFGTAALAGARLYLGHPELSHKRLESLAFNIDWMGKPADLAAHYRNYEAVANAATFQARLSLIDQNLELVLRQAALLFGNSTAGATGHTITISNLPTAIENARPGYVYQPLAGLESGDDDLLAWGRYLQWELNPPDFQSQTYPALAAQKSVELAVAIANKEANSPVDAGAYQVNPPYTPKIKTLTLDYTAALAEIVSEEYDPAARPDRLFHIHPFGYSEFEAHTAARPAFFLPQFDYEGELYIGLRAVNPPQNLSLLFQMAEGSADPDLEPAPVTWSYLSGNRWLSLEAGALLRDTTRGLINSGIVTFSLAPAHPNTLLPPELYWIRAAIATDSNSVCDTIAIEAQAVSATFVDRGNAPDHLSQPLPPGSITDLAERRAAVKGVRQPYTSFGGKRPEQDRHFYTRISERLRHKQRALTMWDYERLILDRFPEIYKVKCLPADPARPGQVVVVVIPDIRNKRPFNPFEPKAPADLIAAIKAYLVEHTPPFAAVTVKNAHYVPVKTRFGVRFRPGYNEGFYKPRLNEALNRFLSPWAYEDSAEIEIGGRIYANLLINFIEEQPYVDYVAEIRLFSSEDGRSFKLARPTAEEGYWLETDRPDGVLVAARQHAIDVISETGYEADDFTGLNYMKIELDFIVA